LENKKISLGLKQLEDNPYEEIREKMLKGQTIAGKVKTITDFGAFVDLGNEIEGLVHISQLSDERVEDISEFVKVDDEVTVKVLEVNADDKKIRLTMKSTDIETNMGEIKTELSGGNDSGNLSMAEAFGDQLRKLNFKDSDE